MAGLFSMLQYQTDPPYQPTLLDDQGNKFVYLGYTPSNFSIKFERVSDGLLKLGVGTFSVDTTNNLLAYQWNVADTNTAGPSNTQATWTIFLDVIMPSGFKRRFQDTLIIKPAP